jgi:hypothetical protein
MIHDFGEKIMKCWALLGKLMTFGLTSELSLSLSLSLSPLLPTPTHSGMWVYRGLEDPPYQGFRVKCK